MAAAKPGSSAKLWSYIRVDEIPRHFETVGEDKHSVIGSYDIRVPRTVAFEATLLGPVRPRDKGKKLPVEAPSRRFPGFWGENCVQDPMSRSLNGCGSKLLRQAYAGFSWFHVPRPLWSPCF